MRDLFHNFLVLCGVVLVGLRLYPAKPGGWISELFLDDVIHVRIKAATVEMISLSGLASSAYRELASNLDSLAHAFAICFEAVIIGLVFYALTRKI